MFSFSLVCASFWFVGRERVWGGADGGGEALLLGHGAALRQGRDSASRERVCASRRLCQAPHCSRQRAVSWRRRRHPVLLRCQVCLLPRRFVVVTFPRFAVSSSYIQFSEVLRGLVPALISAVIVPQLGLFKVCVLLFFCCRSSEKNSGTNSLGST